MTSSGKVGRLLPLLCLLLQLWTRGCSAACSSCSNIANVPHGFQAVSYSETSDFIDNPDRGLYKHLETTVSGFHGLSVGGLDEYRSKEGLTLALRIYVMQGYADRSLPSSFIDHVRADLQTLRQAGWTAILRFSYTSTDPQDRPGPYGDATLSIMKQHIEQLKHAWTEFAGTIAVIQAGFIGVWGEWYYTTYFGDPKHPDPHGPHSLSPAHWQARKDLLEAILDAAPKSIPVQIRTPFSKMQFYGTSATGLADVMAGSHKGRTGHHNDCFLADDTDVGTYANIDAEKNFLQADTMYLPIGGETCGRAPLHNGHRRSDCPTALAEMRRFHWSYVNNGYNPDVLSDWKSQHCYDEIKKYLGYRLYLKKAVLPTSVDAGGDLCYHITLANSGFAAPYKSWKVSLVLKEGNAYYSAALSDVNVRTWLPGNDHVISGSVQVPSSLHGSFDLYLAMVEPGMEGWSDSYVLLANTGNSGPSSGLNPLHHRVQVSGHGSSHTTCPSLSTWHTPHQSRYPRMSGNHAPASGHSPTDSCSPVAISNPSFENSDHSWGAYHGGFLFSTTAPHTGRHCIQVEDGGAYQEFKFSPPVYKMVLTAYSRHSGQSHAPTSDYSLYCDLVTPSGENIYGKYEPFTAGNNNWHKVQLNIDVSKGISSASCNLLYRNLGSLGHHAYFDDVKAWTLPASVSFSDCPT